MDNLTLLICEFKLRISPYLDNIMSYLFQAHDVNISFFLKLNFFNYIF